MGWLPWHLERLAHPRDFVQAIRGFQWRLDRALDDAAFVAYHVLIAAGGGKKADGSVFEVGEMLGRELFAPLVEPAPPDQATLEEQEFEALQNAARAERAKLQIWAAMKARAARDRGDDPTPWDRNG